MQNIEDLTAEYQIAKATRDAAIESFEKAENALCQEMLVARDKTVIVGLRDTTYRVTVVQKETPRIDEAGLREELGALKYRKLCKPARADLHLIEKAIQANTVDIAIVSKFITYNKSKPYISLTAVVEQ